ncbi:MAG TPA: DUF2637 domain-containing protein [Streptosporangiaceae bacterium]|jgi:hypothetical protein
MTGGRAIRWSTVAAVAGVAIVAGWVSYLHAYDVVAAHGEHGILARLYPGTIDGLIYAASMVLLDAARRGVQPPRLARWLLSAGIGATLFANVLAGAAYGVLGAAVAAWPAAALVGSYELLMWLVRQGVTTEPGAVPDVPAGLNGHAHAAAELFAADLDAGRVPGIRAIRSGLHVGQDKAGQVQAYLRGLTRTP